MVTVGRTLRMLVGAAAVACSGSTPPNETGADAANDGLEAQGTPSVAADASGGPTTNVAPVVVDNGPAGVQAVNTLYTTVTLCRPGTTICQTIDHIEVDTGSAGVRILSSLLEPALMLPRPMAADGNPLVECYRYADGYNWGPVATADVHIGGELAAAVPIQIAGGAGSTPIPSDCSSAGTEEDTVMALGGNGLIGIGFQTADCGGTCAGANPPNGAYYSCTSTACMVASLPIPQQVQNPVGLFARDNNGVAVRLPAIDPAGAATVVGSLIFGIGTAPNNGLGAAQVLTTDTTNGYFTTTFSAQSATGGPAATLVGFIDSGSLSYALPDTSIPQCSGSAALMGFFCPPMSLTLMATNTGHNQVSIVTSFSVAAADGLYGSGHAAFDDLAITDFGPGGYFDWGLPFFYGRTIFSAISGAMTPGGVGPYFAY